MNFYKYHGTGNDFIMVDGIAQEIDFSALTTEKIAKLCHRRFGIGADGFIILSASSQHDFKMIYFNSDGNESTMCGNGARCLIRFAADLNYIKGHCTFEAIDGLHEGKVEDLISVKMSDVKGVDKFEADYVIQTGSPHYVKFVQSVDLNSFVEDAKAIRHNPTFDKEGINVNFVEVLTTDIIKIRTFERGVEDETYSCGTGVVGASLVTSFIKKETTGPIKIETLGGDLEVSFESNGKGFENIWLKGPAVLVFEGNFELT